MDQVEKKEILLVTANIGSLFEQNDELLQYNWLLELKKLVSQRCPVFIALHLQEVGGKSHDTCIEAIQQFIKNIWNYLDNFCYSQSFVDNEVIEEKYTAMGCCYFVHKSLSDVEVYDFTTQSYCAIPLLNEIHNITGDSCYIKKFKFPLECFSKNIVRVPRKGFLWSKWKLLQKTFDFVNIHLPHDACNVQASLKCPTKYAKYRRKTLQYALDRIKVSPANHQLLFGDFNVRPDTKAFVEHVTFSGVEKEIIQNKEDKFPKSIRYCSTTKSKSKVVLKIESRTFLLNNYEIFNRENISNLILKFDRELDWMKEQYVYKEFDIKFQPTYPHKEDPKDTSDITFASVRCPAWCDRILMDAKLYDYLIKKNANIEYESYGLDTIIGDHKPVFLSFSLWDTTDLASYLQYLII